MLGTARRRCCWAALAGLWMTRAAVVWVVCSDWGLPSAVHSAGISRVSASRLRTGICTAGAVTGGVAVPKVFWWGRLPAGD
jgi:hypothetical protein